MPQDWFAANAPKAEGDWFAKNAPKAEPAPKHEAAKPFKSEAGFRGIEATADAVRGIPDIVRNLFNSETRGATLSGGVEGVKSAHRDFNSALGEEVEGGKDLGKMTAQMARHPVDSAKAIGGSFVEAGKAIPDVVRNTSPWSASSTPETRMASAGGFARGAAEGLAGVDGDDAATNPLRAIGTMLTMTAGGGVAKAATPYIKRGATAIKGSLKTIPPGVPGGHLVKVPIKPISVESALSNTLEGMRKTTAGVELPPPAFSMGAGAPPAQPRVSIKGTPTPVAKPAKPVPVSPNAGGKLAGASSRPASVPPNANPVAAISEALDGLQGKAAPPKAAAAPRAHVESPVVEAPIASPESPTASPRERRGVPAAEGAEAPRYAGPDRRSADNSTRRANEAVRAELDAAYADYTGPERRNSLTAGDKGFDTTANKVAAGEKIGSPNARAVLDSKNSGEAARNAIAEAEGRPTGRASAPTDLGSMTIGDLPESWQKMIAEMQKAKLATAEGAAAKPVVPPTAALPDVDAPFWSRGPSQGTATDMRAVMGAEKAGAEMGMSADAVRDISGRPKRQPLAATNAEMDSNYLRRINDERGAIDPKLMRDIGLGTAGAATGAALANDDSKVAGGVLGGIGGLAAANPMRAARTLQQLRVIGMLSGAALPKSIAGNIGAIGTSAIEQGSMRPIKEALRVPTNVRAAVAGWKNNANPAHIAGMGRFNLPARAMGALDHTTTNILQRGGESLPGAQRLLLTNPNTLGAGNFGNSMRGSIGRAAFPFQNTPFNGVAEGLKSLDGLAGTGAMAHAPHSKTMKALTAGSIAAGAGAGASTDDPRLLALAAALFGPRGVPFALGTAATAGPRIAAKIGVRLPEGGVEDFADPAEVARPITDPAILRFLDWLRGQEQR